MACLRLTSICVFLVFAGQALSQERARPHPPNITIVPVSPSLSIGEPSLPSLEEPSLRDPIENPSLPAAIGDRTTEILSSLSDHVAVSKIEEELALRCRLHGLDLYPAKRDGLAAIAARVTEYDRLVRTRDVRGSRYVVSTRSKLNDTCRDLIDSVRVRALQQSIRVKTESVAFNKASVEVQPTLDRPELIEEFFPWPPRWPTSRWPAAPDLFADRNRFQTLANVNDFLRQKLQEAGYGEYGYFKIKNTGFAIVTQLERINKKGEPDPAKRFDPSLKPTSSFNLAEYVYRLFLGATGHYGVFVFLFTPELVEPQPPSKQIEYSLAREWNQHGTDVLPPNIGALPVTAEHKLTVLVYEFIYREREKSPPYVLSSGGINPAQHLAATKIKLRP